MNAIQPRSTPHIVARCGPGFVEQRDSVKIVHTYGNPWQRGYEHGLMLRDEIRACFKNVWVDGFFRMSPLFPPFLWYAWSKVQERFLSADEKSELKGLAKGSGLRYEDVLVMNSDSPFDVAANLVQGGSVALTACTQFVLRAGATSTGHTLVGRNLDMISLERLHPYTCIQVSHPENGQAFMTPGFAGKVLDAVTGWNESGVHVAQNVGELRHENALGLYSGALVRRLVEKCRTPAEVDVMVRRTKYISGGGRIISATSVGDARIIDMAQSTWDGLFGHKKVHVRDAGQMGIFTNHFQSSGSPTSPGLPSDSSRHRLMRAQQLGGVYSGRFDTEALKKCLTDKTHAVTGEVHGPQSPSAEVINWYGPRVEVMGPFKVPSDLDVHVATTISTVSDLHAGIMWIALGQPYMSSPADYIPINAPDELTRQAP